MDRATLASMNRAGERNLAAFADESPLPSRLADIFIDTLEYIITEPAMLDRVRDSLKKLKPPPKPRNPASRGRGRPRKSGLTREEAQAAQEEKRSSSATIPLAATKGIGAVKQVGNGKYVAIKGRAAHFSDQEESSESSQGEEEEEESSKQEEEESNPDTESDEEVRGRNKKITSKAEAIAEKKKVEAAVAKKKSSLEGASKNKRLPSLFEDEASEDEEAAFSTKPEKKKRRLLRKDSSSSSSSSSSDSDTGMSSSSDDDIVEVSEPVPATAAKKVLPPTTVSTIPSPIAPKAAAEEEEPADLEEAEALKAFLTSPEPSPVKKAAAVLPTPVAEKKPMVKFAERIAFEAKKAPPPNPFAGKVAEFLALHKEMAGKVGAIRERMEDLKAADDWEDEHADEVDTLKVQLLGFSKPARENRSNIKAFIEEAGSGLAEADKKKLQDCIVSYGKLVA